MLRQYKFNKPKSFYARYGQLIGIGVECFLGFVYWFVFARFRDTYSIDYYPFYKMGVFSIVT